MSFPTPGGVQGTEYVHPETGQRYVLGPNDVWQKISKITELEDTFVTDEEFNEDQQRQDDVDAVQNGQINALETQIQLLAGVRAVGRWTYRRRIESSSPRPPYNASFYGTHKDDINTVLTDWADINLLMINKTDLDGNTFAFSQFEEGDKVEVIAADGSSAVFGTVTNNPSNDVYANMILTVERSNGGPTEDTEYLISAYRPGSSNGEVDLDILDGRYLVKTGDTMTGNLYLDTGSGLYSKEIIKSTRNTGYAFQVKPNDAGDATAFIHTNGSAHFGATSFDDVISFSGDSRIKAKDANGNVNLTIYPSGMFDSKNEIRIDRSGTEQCFVVRQDSSPKFTIQANGKAVSQYAVAADDDDKVLATKEYVDQNSGGSPVPALWRWQWKGETTDQRIADLAAGQFIGPQLGTGSSSYSSSYYFHLKPQNSAYTIYQRTYVEELLFNSADGAPLLSVWYVGGSTENDYQEGKVILQCVQRVKRFTLAKNGSGSGEGPFFEVEIHPGSQYSNHFSGTGHTINRTYYVSLAGIF